MLRNYLKVAWRSIVKNKFHSALNIFGLSIGLGFTMLVAAFLWAQLQVNKNLKNAGRQYILQSRWKDPNLGGELTTLGPLARALKEQYPGLVSNYYRFDGITSNVSRGNISFRQDLQVGDSTLLNMYGFELLHGSATEALKHPSSVVIGDAAAIKYFGKTDVVGRSLTIESFSGSKRDFTITAVMKDPGENSVTRLLPSNHNQLFIPLEALKFFNRDMSTWLNAGVVGFIELQKGVDISALKAPIQHLVETHAPEQIRANMQPYLVPLTSYYLDANNRLLRKMLYTVSFIAAFILLMAIINFVNISVSKSSIRIKEIGVRKVLGGLRKELLQQFLFESVFLTGIATLFAILLYVLFRPLLSGILGREIPAFNSFPAVFLLGPLGLLLVIGVLAGFYPAILLSKLKASDSIKGKLRSVNENIMLRKSLLAFQFSTASIVFIGAIVVSQQVSLFFSKELGYDKDYVLSAQVPRDWSASGVQKLRTIRNEFLDVPQVSSAALSYQIPNGNNIGGVSVYRKDLDSTQSVATVAMITDEHYQTTYGLTMSAGNFFSPAYKPQDSSHIVINETAVRALRFSSNADAVGAVVRATGGGNDLTIAGVVKDYHFGSMQTHIQPVTLFNVDLWNNYRYLSFKIKPGNVSAAVAALSARWAALFPGVAFEYTFMDDTLARLYQSEIQLKKAAQAATALAIVIVLLGVTGLVSISIQKRTKEIAIRKVLGAATANVVRLFLKDFLPVIAVAGIISTAPAYLLMRQWLNNYSVKINLSALPFIASIVSLGAITTLLIVLRIARASIQNPAKQLRTE
ncbi:ABC transporter permease [Segetibacter sp. 3557_3]|uniref:ABC transporter permease n=1 Tax=Segetibacter sp. 3557_3 TaxID=2547429 RepID=UPI001058FDA6|nr:ABC transporter permease [Segetibacter sp. 3557_3]TDH24205.1 ABC transporter permease [Segetibacter sp. 3557_3]